MNFSSGVTLAKAKLKRDYPWTKINQLDFRFRGKWDGGILLGILLLLTSCSQPDLPKGIFTKVERVISGQTLEILDKTSKIPVLQQVRLAGITAPDLKQDPWGVKAKQSLKQLCEGKKILLEGNLTEKDRYGRISAYIWLDGILINEQLVKQGYVLAETPSIYRPVTSNFKTQYSQRFNDAQEYARLMGYGIWNPEKPMRLTPTEFRDQQPQSNSSLP
ncbi:thermonuclease family protein [Planktothrix serta]|uniref:thermonuclease family protein n=1 Tax=Planktothrix serta TaxID=1678310 RepID=UPI0009FA3C78|nr:thermonuclease family protein [Planktothrix serta]